MILIADAGATKTDWRLMEGQKIHQFKSEGFNPRTHSIALFINSLPEEIVRRKSEVKRLYYYGAGLSDPAINNRLRGLLQAEFDHSRIVIESDLLGTARSLFGSEAGVACIMGTGSAACFYDGKTITRRVPSLGYVLGDEGSGACLGRGVLNQYLRGLLPSNIQRQFKSEFGDLSENLVLRKVYDEPTANTYLAQFASFVIDNQSDPFMYQYAYRAVETFFQRYFGVFTEIQQQKIRFTGSVAYYLSNIIRKFATDNQLNVDLVSKSPISGLTLYHQENG